MGGKKLSNPKSVTVHRKANDIVFLGKILYSDTLSHHPGVQMGTSHLLGGGLSKC